jgi:hypothetical protein
MHALLLLLLQPQRQPQIQSTTHNTCLCPICSIGCTICSSTAAA